MCALAGGKGETGVRPNLCQPEPASGRAGDVASKTPAVHALEGDVATRWRRRLQRIAFDITRARRAAERLAVSVVGDEVQRLGRVERIGTGLTHYGSVKTSVIPYQRVYRHPMHKCNHPWKPPPFDERPRRVAGRVTRCRHERSADHSRGRSPRGHETDIDTTLPQRRGMRGGCRLVGRAG